jgi:hypothetical protein
MGMPLKLVLRGFGASGPFDEAPENSRTKHRMPTVQAAINSIMNRAVFMTDLPLGPRTPSCIHGAKAVPVVLTARRWSFFAPRFDVAAL